MAQVGDEQAATRALAEAAQERQGLMFITHHQFVKQNEELMRRIAAEQNLVFKLAERLGPGPAPEQRPVQLAQGAMVGRTQHRECATPGEHEMQLPQPGSPLRSQRDGTLRCCVWCAMWTHVSTDIAGCTLPRLRGNDSLSKCGTCHDRGRAQNNRPIAGSSRALPPSTSTYCQDGEDDIWLAGLELAEKQYASLSSFPVRKRQRRPQALQPCVLRRCSARRPRVL